MCKKKSFDNWWDAQTRLKEINPKNEDDKPQRAYKCIDCGFWHLTKISAENNNKRAMKIAEKNKNREEKFINRETNFWNKKFKIE